MPFALITIGLLLIISGARGTYGQLKDLLVSDFTGPHNFINWIAAIAAVGMLGYFEPLKVLSRTFLALIVVGMFLSQRGFFTRFQQAIAQLGGASSS